MTRKRNLDNFKRRVKDHLRSPKYQGKQLVFVCAKIILANGTDFFFCVAALSRLDLLVWEILWRENDFKLMENQTSFEVIFHAN